jgi:hypothetical protein
VCGQQWLRASGFQLLAHADCILELDEAAPIHPVIDALAPTDTKREIHQM